MQHLGQRVDILVVYYAKNIFFEPAKDDFLKLLLFSFWHNLEEVDIEYQLWVDLGVYLDSLPRNFNCSNIVYRCDVLLIPNESFKGTEES